jgi:hypothetical protein
MDLSIVVILLGIVLVNGTTVITAWIRVKTELAQQRIEISDNSERIKELDRYRLQMLDSINIKLEKIDDTNTRQHEAIADKIDKIKQCIGDINVNIAKMK